MPLTVTSSWPVITRISVLLLLCGCTAPAAIEPETAAGCDQMAAQRLVGMARPSDEDAARRTNAKIVRQIAPGQMVTQDYREERVTITTDSTSGRVVAARCG